MRRYSWLREDPVQAPVTRGDLDQLENYADRLFAKVGIDVEFTRHFLDRVNDERNKKQITLAELTRIFKQEFKRYGKKIAQLGPDAEAVMQDMKTDVNIPFVLVYDRANKELDLIAKTVMRKQNFATPNPVFQVETKVKRNLDEPGSYLLTFNNKEYKISKFYDPESLRHKGEWTIHVKDKGEWEWEDTVYGYKTALDRIKSLNEAWSAKYKKSIDCNNPKGFSQKAHCAGRKKKAKESLREGRDADLYHETDEAGIIGILSSGAIIPKNVYTDREAGEEAEIGPRISLTRDFELGLNDFKLIIDQTKLAQTHKITPFTPEEMRDEVENEAEEYVQKPIPLRYIKAIYLEFEDDATDELIDLAKKANIPLVTGDRRNLEPIEDIEETKEAPPGTYFTKTGNLVKGRLTKDAKARGARQTDPKDKQRSKVPPVTQYNEEEQCKPGEYYCNEDQMCKPIPDGYIVRSDGYLVPEGKRIPRKKGQPAGSKKHSDLYTDENPKGTIQGLKFATVKDAEASVNKIKNSGKKHAHKIQAAVAMEQRAKAAGKKSAAAVYRRYINAMKKKTKQKNEAAGVGIVTKQNATKDVPVGGEYMNIKKLGLGKGKPKELHKKARKNSDPNKLFNLGLTESVDVSTQRGRLAYYLKQPKIEQGMAVHLGKLPKYYDGKDELADMVPDRVGVYALHPDAWEGTFYSLTNKDLDKITRYRPAIVKIPANSVVGDMAIANQFYRTDDADEKKVYAKAYRDSLVPYGSDTSHIKMPEIIMSRLIENEEIETLNKSELHEVSMLQKIKQKALPGLKPELYKKAADVLHSVLTRKSKEGKLKHGLPYYAMAVGRTFHGIDYRTLATYYQDHYDLAALNELRYERLPKDDDLNFGQRRKVKFKTDKKLPNLKMPTKATRADRIRAMLAMPESEEDYIEEGWKQTLSNLVLGAGLTLGGLGALTVKQALDSPDFNKAEKLEIFTAANLPASQLPDELKLPIPRPEIQYKPLTNNPNEKILAKVAKQNGIKGIELAAFMSQMAHESEDFSDMVEDNPDVKKYATRLAKALGNKSMNDAERFIGRGYVQLTGRWNYEWMEKSLGIDLTSSWSKAHQASDPKIAAMIAVEFWKQRVRPKVSDFGDVAAVTKPINSKLHGLKHRQARFSKMASRMNELKIVKPDTKDTFGITRANMPQVAGKHYGELLDYLKDSGANFKMETVLANTLKAMQGEFSDAGIVKSLGKKMDGKGKKPIIASMDDYIIDGHHRWLAALNTGPEEEVDIIRVNKTGKDLLQMVIDFPKTTYKDIYNGK